MAPKQHRGGSAGRGSKPGMAAYHRTEIGKARDVEHGRHMAAVRDEAYTQARAAEGKKRARESNELYPETEEEIAELAKTKSLEAISWERCVVLKRLDDRLKMSKSARALFPSERRSADPEVLPGLLRARDLGFALKYLMLFHTTPIAAETLRAALNSELRGKQAVLAMQKDKCFGKVAELVGMDRRLSNDDVKFLLTLAGSKERLSKILFQASSELCTGKIVMNGMLDHWRDFVEKESAGLTWSYGKYTMAWNPALAFAKPKRPRCEAESSTVRETDTEELSHVEDDIFSPLSPEPPYFPADNVTVHDFYHRINDRVATAHFFGVTTAGMEECLGAAGWKKNDIDQRAQAVERHDLEDFVIPLGDMGFTAQTIATLFRHPIAHRDLMTKFRELCAPRKLAERVQGRAKGLFEESDLHWLNLVDLLWIYDNVDHRRFAGALFEMSLGGHGGEPSRKHHLRDQKLWNLWWNFTTAVLTNVELSKDESSLGMVAWAGARHSWNPHLLSPEQIDEIYEELWPARAAVQKQEAPKLAMRQCSHQRCPFCRSSRTSSGHRRT